MTPDEERFWSFVDRSRGPDGCWLWFGRIKKRGRYWYPRFKVSEHDRKAIVWAIYYTSGVMYQPGDIRMFRTCDEQMCVNPAHRRIVHYYTGEGICRLGGHPMTPEHRIYMNGNIPECRDCHQARHLEWQRLDRIRKREAARNDRADG